MVSVLLVLDLFMWVAAHASGHKIPIKTDLSCGISALVLAGILFILFLKGKR